LLEHITSAGAVFLGAYSSESLGDYCAGSNHVLPTSGAARFSSPLGVYDFQTRSSVIEISQEGAHALANVAGTIADGESLTAHALAARARTRTRTQK
jgi:histidinol dehydrogenase